MDILDDPNLTVPCGPDPDPWPIPPIVLHGIPAGGNSFSTGACETSDLKESCDMCPRGKICHTYYRHECFKNMIERFVYARTNIPKL